MNSDEGRLTSYYMETSMCAKLCKFATAGVQHKYSQMHTVDGVPYRHGSVPESAARHENKVAMESMLMDLAAGTHIRWRTVPARRCA